MLSWLLQKLSHVPGGATRCSRDLERGVRAAQGKMKDRVRRLLAQCPTLRYQFILIELDAAITYRRGAAAMKNGVRREWATRQAKQARKAALDLADGELLKNMPQGIGPKSIELEKLIARLQGSRLKTPVRHRRGN